MTGVPPILETPPDDIWTQLKQVSQDFALRQVKNRSWDFIVDLTRFSFGSIKKGSANNIIDVIQRNNEKLAQILPNLGGN